MDAPQGRVRPDSGLNILGCLGQTTRTGRSPKVQISSRWAADLEGMAANPLGRAGGEG